MSFTVVPVHKHHSSLFITFLIASSSRQIQSTITINHHHLAIFLL